MNNPKVQSGHARSIESAPHLTSDYKRPLAPTDPFLARPQLAYLSSLIGDASVVAFGEPTHGVAEPLDARDALFKYLIEERGVRTIAIESGMAEADLINRHVLGGSVSLDDAVSHGFTWGFGLLPQNRRLVRWLAEHNRNRATGDQVRFYGFDLPGSPANLNCARWYDVPLTQALNFLRSYFPVLSANIEPSLREVILESAAGATYESAAQLEVVLKRDPDRTTSAIAMLNAILLSHEHQLVAASSRDEFDSAMRAAIGAVQLDANIRMLPKCLLDAGPRNVKSVIASASDPLPRSTFDDLLAAQNVRDRAMADNVRRLLRDQERGKKMMLFASACHVSADSCTFTWGGHSGRLEPAGTYLRGWLGEQLFVIGSTAGAGSLSFEAQFLELPEPAGDTLDALCGGSREPSHLLDLHRLPKAEFEAFDQERPLAHSTGFSLNAARAFDAITHFQTLSSAQPAPC